MLAYGIVARTVAIIIPATNNPPPIIKKIYRRCITPFFSLSDISHISFDCYKSCSICDAFKEDLFLKQAFLRFMPCKQLRGRITLLHLDPVSPYCNMSSEIIGLVENARDLLIRQQIPTEQQSPAKGYIDSSSYPLGVDNCIQKKVEWFFPPSSHY